MSTRAAVAALLAATGHTIGAVAASVALVGAFAASIVIMYGVSEVTTLVRPGSARTTTFTPQPFC